MTLDEDEIAAWTVATRAACGLGPTIEDEATLSRIATLAFADPPTEGGDRRGPPDGQETGRPPAKTDARPATPVRAANRNASPPSQSGQDGTSVREGGGHAP
jgi:hypothetical protein